MDRRISDNIDLIISGFTSGNKKKFGALLGFDACIDNIVRIVKGKSGDGDNDYFADSDQLGKFLLDLGNRSCGLELQSKLSKVGGNMVITANALGNLGVHTDCIGTFGIPDILPVFRSMSPNCNLLTIGETITATALEFNDSKVVMFDPGPYNTLTWDGIKNTIGINRIKDLLSGRQLISFLNWSEIENSSLIWRGILDDVLPFIDWTYIKPSFFTDFSDCSRRSKEEIKSAVDLLSQFRNYFKVTISLNQNEADLIADAMGISPVSTDEEHIRSIFEKVSADILVIHRVKDAMAFDGISFEKCETFFCEQPVILTGGGDNFNAGFCFSQLYEFDLFQSLLIANAVSGCYVKTGVSPDMDSLIQFLQKQLFNQNREN